MSTWLWIWFAGSALLHGMTAFWTHVIRDDEGHVQRAVGVLLWVALVLPIVMAAWVTAPWHR